LLVVVAILAILAAMLLPALQKAKTAGKRAQCMSNLHQWGIAFYAYADDWNDSLPLPAYWGGDQIEGCYIMRWNQLINHAVMYPNYIKTPELLFCPDFRGNPYPDGTPFYVNSDIGPKWFRWAITNNYDNPYGGGGFICSYAMPPRQNKSDGSSYVNDPWPWPNNGVGNQFLGGKLSKNLAVDTSYGTKTYWLLMCMQEHFPGFGHEGFTSHDGNASNVLFADGRVVFMLYPWKQRQEYYIQFAWLNILAAYEK
jgi:prepilin-type processing-associated H-X9-DG protein